MPEDRRETGRNAGGRSDGAAAPMIRVEVAYARPDAQVIEAVQVPDGSPIEHAIRQSGLLKRFPEIDLDRQKVGIFGRLRGLEESLRAGDRVEIYRPLQADPKESRRRRARQEARQDRSA